LVEFYNFLSRDGAYNRALVPKMIFAKIMDQHIYIYGLMFSGWARAMTWLARALSDVAEFEFIY
jgi:hypothetical protein